MNPSKYAFQAGLFILLSIAVAIFLIARVADRGGPSDARAYTAVFGAGDDIAGLAAGNEVRLLGVEVGRIESVRIVTPENSEEDAAIHVGFVVGKGVELRQDGPQIELQTGLTGGAWLNIMSVGTGQPLAQGGRVDAQTASLLGIMAELREEMTLTLAELREDMDEVSTELVQTADGIEQFANSADTLVKKIDQEVDVLDGQVEKLLTESTAVMGDIRGVFGDSGDDIRTTLSKLGSLTTSLDAQLPQTLAEINGFIDKTENSIDGVDTLIAELTGTASEARAMLSENRPDIDRAIRSARRSVDELEGLVDDLRANPSRLIWPPDEKDLNNNSLYAAARSYAKAAEDLESAAAALHTATKDGDADQEELEALRSDLVRQFDYFEKLQAEVWERFEK